MSTLLDRGLAALAIAAACYYAVIKLAPRALRVAVLQWLVRRAAHMPAGPGVSRTRQRFSRALDRLTAQSGCGGCGSCAADGVEAKSAEQHISPASIGRRGPPG